MSQYDPIPVMMRLIEANPNTPRSLSKWKDCIFIVKLYVYSSKRSTDPLIEIDVELPPTNKQQPGHTIPTTGAFILTLIGKWNDIAKYNYSALKYTITHLHDDNTDDQAIFDALQEMNRHINACFTHPIAQQMIIKANGQLSVGIQCTITFGLVTNVDRTKYTHPTTIINPCDRTQDILSNGDPPFRHTPSVGWLCLFVYNSSRYYYYYHLPIVDLSQHTQFMTTYNPQDLPPVEAAAYNALLDKWQNEKSTKQLSSRIPKPNELNPYTYVEAWNYVMQPIKDAEAKAALEKQRKQEQEQQKEEQRQRQLEQYINSKSTRQFEEYKRLLLEQQQNDIYNILFGAKLSQYDLNNTDGSTSNTFRNATTTNQTSSFISSLLNNNNKNDNNNNDNNGNINTNTLSLPLASSSSLQHTLFNEYYYKEYIKSQLDDLTIMNHLQYYQYLSSSSTLSSGTTYRPRPHIALPLPSSSSSSTPTTNTSSSSSSSPTTTSTSTIDTLIDLATSLPPPPPQSTTAALVKYTNNNVTSSVAVMGDIDDNNDINTCNNNNNTINNTNQQPTIIIPHQQTTIFNNTNRQQLILLKEQYNNILGQKHILTIQYDDLINKYNTILQTNETYNKQIITLQQQIMTLEEQLQSSNIQIQTLQTQITTLQDEMITLKDEHANEITTLKEECHRKEIGAKDLLLTAYNKNTTLTSNSNDIPPHILNHISFLQQQLESANTTYQQQITELTQSKDKQIQLQHKQLETKDKQLETKDKQLESKEAIHQQQITELTQSKDKQLEAKDKQIAELTQSKDKQLEAKDKQITELTQSKDRQLESKDQQIALLMQMLAESNKK